MLSATLLSAVFLIAFIVPVNLIAPAAPLTRDTTLALGRLDTKRFLSGEEKPLWASMSDAMKTGLKNEDTLETMHRQIDAQFGAEDKILHEDALPAPNEIMVYTRTVKFHNYPTPLVITFAFGQPKDGRDVSIEGFHITPEANPAPSSYMEYKDKTPLFFPLEGKWTIYQGGRTVSQNYHAVAADERFAYDITLIKDGALYKGDGTRNEQWYGFAQPVLADGKGMIALASDTLTDNPPNEPSLTAARYGNTVVIDHGTGEFSMYAHLKHGSILVKAGDPVTPGQRIALTGNSGNSPFTHLHYHLQTTAVWFGGEGLPIFFRNISVNGSTLENAEPVRGDVVESHLTTQ